MALGQIFSRVLRFSLVNFIPPLLHYTEKHKKSIFFITGLHNEPEGCGASVACAAGSFAKKNMSCCYMKYTKSVYTFCAPMSVMKLRSAQSADPVVANTSQAQLNVTVIFSYVHEDKIANIRIT